MGTIDALRSRWRFGSMLMRIIYINIAVFLTLMLMNLVCSLINSAFSSIVLTWIELPSNPEVFLSPLKALIDNPTSKNRFSVLDTVTVDRKVKIFVEGKTDAQILEHAFMVLTNGCTPYWKITVATQNGKDGSSTIVSKELDAAYGYSSDYNTVIGCGLSCKL